MNLSPIPERGIDARLVAHIEPDETLLWQAQPEVPSISNRLGILSSLVGMLSGLALLLGLGPAVYPPLAMASGSSIVTGLSVLAFSGVFLFAGWQIMVSNDYDGPLRLFGFTILPRIIRTREERVYGEGKPWTTLKVRGVPDAGLSLVVRATPLTQTLDGVVNDPWNKRLGLEFLRRTPDLRIGPLEGFSVLRKMPGGAMLTGFGRVNNPVATRMVWLGRGNTSVELTGMARLDQPQVQDAIDAMVDTLLY